MSSRSERQRPTPRLQTGVSRNNRMARGRWVRLLTSSTERNPRKPSNCADSRAFSKVLRENGSISSAASGTPQPSAISRIIAASATGPAPPPESTSSGAAPSWKSPTPRSTRRISAPEGEPPGPTRQPRTTMASASLAKGLRACGCSVGAFGLGGVRRAMGAGLDPPHCATQAGRLRTEDASWDRLPVSKS